MTFGTGRWARMRAPRAIFQAYREAGGQFVDTADIYAGGVGEEMVGRFIAETGSRHGVVLTTLPGRARGSASLSRRSVGRFMTSRRRLERACSTECRMGRSGLRRGGPSRRP